MTSTAPSTISATPRSPQWRRATRIMLRIGLEHAAWAWALAIVVVAAILFTISRFIEPQMSAVQFTYHAALWYQFAMVITAFMSYAGAHVANGLTRRSFIRATLIVAGATAIAYAAVITLLLLVEERIYRQLGWYHGLSNIDGEVLASGTWPYVWGALLIFAVGNLSGLLVAASYYRLGGWWGTVCLPLTLAPLLLVSVFAMDHEVQWTPWDLTTGVLGAASSVLAAGVIAAGVYAYYRLVRSMPISTSAS